VGIAGIALASLWAFGLVMNLLVVRFFDGDMGMGGAAIWPYPGVVVAIAGFLLSVGIVFVAGFLSLRPALLLDVGLGFMVVTAALLGFLNQWQPIDAATRLSSIAALILIYPAIAPNTPGKVLAACLAAASMDPVWFGVATLRGVEHDVPAFAMLWAFGSTYLCAGLAVLPVKVIRKLGGQVRRARELGSYRLGERIGSGGMGDVFRAEHRLLARPAAIKLIRPELAANGTARDGEVAAERFRREAEAAALLRSPHTIELYDFGIASDGAFYYVMELLDGLSFEDLVGRHGPVPAERAVHLMIQTCDSLAEAHAIGLIHRDIKPSNLFASRVGLTVDFVKVLDFGLVKQNTDATITDLTADGVTAGTPAFMAPEIALGGPDIDGRADLYALGCVAYWLLTGRQVFDGDTLVATVLKHVRDEPVPPSQRTELPIPPKLEAVIMQCLAKEPGDRPRTAEELSLRLQASLGGDPWTSYDAKEWWELHRPKAELAA
jgi:serine/threonine-protein kinase